MTELQSYISSRPRRLKIWNNRKDEDGNWASYEDYGLIIYVPALIIQSEK
jgi:hypothetical protein